MIEQLELKNFQSHQDTSLEFTPGVNVILGRSDSGKSAIIRALRWLVYGKPRGDSFRSWWGGDTAVAVKLPTGTITRMKTSSVNGYTLDTPEFQGARGGSGKLPTPGNSPMVFRAIGTDPIMEIDQAINMGELNLQQQADSPYLISSTPGEVASHFSRIAKLEKIQQGLKFVQSKIRQLTGKLDTSETLLTTQRNSYREYGWVDEATPFINALQDTNAARGKLMAVMPQLTSLKLKIEQTQTQLNELSSRVPGQTLISDLQEAVATLKTLRETKGDLILLLSNMNNNRIRAKRMREFIRILPGAESMNQLETLNRQADILSDLLTRIHVTQNNIVDTKTDLQAMKKMLSTVKICPLCGADNTHRHDH